MDAARQDRLWTNTKSDKSQASSSTLNANAAKNEYITFVIHFAKTSNLNQIHFS